MGRTIFQSLANTPPEMLVGRRMAEDWEVLADLPDGTLIVYFLTASAGHSVAGDIRLHIAGELQAWLCREMMRFKIRPEELDDAVIEARISTSRLTTDRSRLVSFDYDCLALLKSGDRSSRSIPVERHVWHHRLPTKSVQSR